MQPHPSLSVPQPAEAAHRWATATDPSIAVDAAPYELTLDEPAGLIRAHARGTWSVEETKRYCADLNALVVRSRRLCGRVRVLLDRRDIVLQSAEVCEILAEANRTIFVGDDKIALVVGTSLAKASLRQRMPHAGTKAFLSIYAAETWLSV